MINYSCKKGINYEYKHKILCLYYIYIISMYNAVIQQ